METNQKITYGIIGVLAVIVAAMGGTMMLTQDQLDHAYICTSNQNVVIADHLSSTYKTAYWTDENNVSKSKSCTGGIWQNLKQYAQQNNISINVLINQAQDTNVTQSSDSEQGIIKYRCDQNNCTRIQ